MDIIIIVGENDAAPYQEKLDAAIGKALSRLAAFNGCAEIIGVFGDGPVREE